MIRDILNIHKSHPPRSFGLYMFHCFNISKPISISVLFFIISILCVVFFAGFLKILAPVLSRFFCPRGSGFRTFFESGGEEFALSKNSPGGWSGLELSDT